MFRQCAAVIWLLGICLSVNAWASTDVVDPSVVHAPIQYPSSAVAAREQGTVLVKVKVDKSGGVVGATVDKSSGHSDLDAAALQSISQWSFSPGMKDGEPEERWVLVSVSFQLKERASNDPTLREYLLAIVSALVWLLGWLIWAIGFVWSVILAKRKSILWLFGMVAFWAFTYPLFVAMNWPIAKRNLILVVIGIFLTGIGFYFTPLQELQK